MNTKHSKTEPTVTTEDEIESTRKLVKEQYGVKLPKKDVIRSVELIKELGWWLDLDRKPSSPLRITDEMAMECQEIYKKTHGKDITLAEAREHARTVLVLVPVKEKKRIGDEMRAIIVTHREVDYSPDLLDKTAKLFEIHYGIKLDDEQTHRMLFVISKSVWFEEGLPESVEKCLDDLLVYVDKRKRGKRVNGLDLHTKVREFLDWAVKNFNLIEKEFEPLARDEDTMKLWAEDGQWYLGDPDLYKKALGRIRSKQEEKSS